MCDLLSLFIEPPAMLLDLTLIALCSTALWHYRGGVHFLVAMYLSLFSFDYKFYVSSVVSCQGLSLGKEKGEKAGKDLSLAVGRGAEECQAGRRRGGNMYGVGKILQLHGRNARVV